VRRTCCLRTWARCASCVGPCCNTPQQQCRHAGCHRMCMCMLGRGEPPSAATLRASIVKCTRACMPGGIPRTEHPHSPRTTRRSNWMHTAGGGPAAGSSRYCGARARASACVCAFSAPRRGGGGVLQPQRCWTAGHAASHVW